MGPKCMGGHFGSYGLGARMWGGCMGGNKRCATCGRLLSRFFPCTDFACLVLPLTLEMFGFTLDP